MNTKRLVLLFLTVVFLISPCSTFAQETSEDSPWKRLSLKFGGAGLATNSTAQVGTSSLGLEVDFEEALGMESSTYVFKFDSLYRASDNRKHALGFSYFTLRRNSTKTLDQDIEFRGQTFLADTKVETHFNISIYRADYNYSFFQDERIDLTAGLGVYVMPMEIGIETAGSGANSESITPVLPILSLGFNFAITPKVFLKQQYGVFYLEYDNFEGAMVATNIAVEYNAFKNVGFGLAYDSLQLRIKAEDEDYPGIDYIGQVTFSYAALIAYMKVYF